MARPKETIRQFYLWECLTLEKALVNDELERHAKWTQAIAVGERAFVEAIEEQIHSRQEMMITEQGGSWGFREEHGVVLGPEKKAMNPYGGPFLA